MKRTILTPAVLAPAALAELKLWLGISTTLDDAPLAALLRTALEVCEGFTGTLPLQCAVEEVLPASSAWQPLEARPVQAITLVQGVPAEGARFSMPVADYAIELDADGGGRVRVLNPGTATRIAVRFSAGLAPDWASLPESLRHGVLRLAAHQHRMRDDDAAAPLPPAAVAALWRPWRRLRLA